MHMVLSPPSPFVRHLLRMYSGSVEQRYQSSHIQRTKEMDKIRPKCSLSSRIRKTTHMEIVFAIVLAHFPFSLNELESDEEK